MMKSGAVAGWRFGLHRWGSACAASAILASAEASASGWPVISAPRRSASYSRERLIAIWMIMAASGARSSMASITTGCGRLSPRPPNRKPNWASDRDGAGDGRR